MKRNKLIVGIGLLLIGVFAVYGFAVAQCDYAFVWARPSEGGPSIDQAFDVAVDSQGDICNVYAVDTASTDGSRILKFSCDGVYDSAWPDKSGALGPIFQDKDNNQDSFSYFHGIAVDSAGNLYIADGNKKRILKFNSDGIHLNTWDISDSADPYRNADDLAVDSQGILYVANTAGQGYVYKIEVNNDDGITSFTGGHYWGEHCFDKPYEIAFDSAGNIYVADGGINNCIAIFDNNRDLVDKWDSDDGYTFSEPHGIVIDSQDYVYVADTAYDPDPLDDDNPLGRIQIFDRIGQTVTEWSTWDSDSFNEPTGIALDAGGYIYVADKGNNRILKFTPVLAVGPITAPSVPVLVNTEINVSAEFTDPNDGDTHTATWDWGDNSTSSVIVDDPGVVTGSHTYTIPGVYTLKLTVTDGDASDEATYEYVVVYDPVGGSVTGGGWIDSPGGASTDNALTGKANFGFVSKYKNGATVPTGETQFNFKAGDLNFHSSNYEWLVVDSPKAQCKGYGTIDGDGNYGFKITVIDAALSGSTDEDLFRIKIWDEDNDDNVVYDTQMGEEDDYADPTTAIGGGSIVVHE